MIRKCSDCQHTPPSLHHQDLKPRVNRANCDMGVLCWNPIVGLGCCCRKKWWPSEGLWWWWNIPEYIRSCSTDLFQCRYYCFVSMKSSTNLQSAVRWTAENDDLLCKKKELSLWGQETESTKNRKSCGRHPYLYIHAREAAMWKSPFLFMNFPRVMCLDRLCESIILLRIRYLSLPIPAVELNGTLYVNNCSDKSYS